MGATTKLCMKKFQRKRLYIRPTNTSCHKATSIMTPPDSPIFATYPRQIAFRLRDCVTVTFCRWAPALTVILIIARTQHKDFVERRKAQVSIIVTYESKALSLSVVAGHRRI